MDARSRWRKLNISELAKLYQNNAGLQFGLGKRLIDEHLHPQAGQTILDLGCGTGQLTCRIASKLQPFVRVVAVDPDDKRLGIAETTLASQYNNATCVNGYMTDVVHLGPYDSIFSNFVLHWVPDENIATTMKSIYDSLKPGGTLCAHTTTHTGQWSNALSLATTGQPENIVTGMYWHRSSYWREICESVGFEVARCVDEGITWPFDNMDAYIDFVKAYTTGKVDGHKLSDAELDQILRDRGVSSQKDPIEINAEIVLIVARKPSHSN